MDQQDRKRINSSSTVSMLTLDSLLKVFSYLPPHSLALSCIVCKDWNKIINDSTLWENICKHSRKQLLQQSSSEDTAEKLKFLHDDFQGIVDWRSQFVKQHHKALIVLGSVAIKDWRGHSTRVECCKFQMGTIVSGSSDGIVRVWSATKGHCLETYAVPNKSRVIDLEFDKNKILAVSGTEIYIWNRVKGRLLRHISVHGQPIHSMCFVDPEVLIGCTDGTLRVFDIYSGQCSRIFRQHTDRITCIVADVSSSILASGSIDGTVQLCDLSTGEKLGCLLDSYVPTGVVCLHLCQHRKNVLVGGTTDGRVHAWDMRSQKLIWRIQVGPNSVTSLHSQFYDATTVFVGCINGMVNVIDVENGLILKRYSVLTPGGRHGRQDLSGRILSFSKHAGNKKALRKHCPPILCLRTGMSTFVSTHPDGTIRLWQLKL